MLALLAGIAGSTALGIIAAQTSSSRWWTALSVWYCRIRYGKGRPGQLGGDALEVLRATTDALLGDTVVEMGPYEDYFRWRSENVSGYKSCYEQFSEVVNQAAVQATGRRFGDGERAFRRLILEEAFQARNAGIKLKGGIQDCQKDWRHFDKYIVQEIFQQFDRRDAWVRLGYEAWPGQPQGLDVYRRAPAQAKSPGHL